VLGEIDDQGGVGLLQVSWTEVEGDPTGGAHLPVEGRGQRRTLLGGLDAGPRDPSGAGPKVTPAAFSYFLYSFSFSFSVFLIYFVPFAKSIQINSNKFLNSSKIQHNVLN
jgi:hypothetical protein